MVRVTFGFENKLSRDGRFLETEAVWWEGEPIPVLDATKNYAIVGKATDIRREEDLSLTAELDVEPPEGHALGFDLSNLSSSTKSGVLRITHARLRAITVIPEERQLWPPGLLGMTPSRNFKIYRTDFPAIFRFNGKLFMEQVNTATMEDRWVEISEKAAGRWLKTKG